MAPSLPLPLPLPLTHLEGCHRQDRPPAHLVRVRLRLRLTIRVGARIRVRVSARSGRQRTW